VFDGGDLTSIVNLGDGDWNTISILAVITSVLVAGYYSLVGGTSGQSGLFVAGNIWLPIVVIGAIISLIYDGGVLKSPAKPYQEAWGLWIGRGVMLVIGAVTGADVLSVFSAPSESGHILSSALQATDPVVQIVINVFQAPINENFLIMSLTVPLWKLTEQIGIESKAGRIVFAVLPTAAIFGGLHGQRSVTFYAMAFAVMAFWILLLYGAELEWFSTNAVPITYMLTVGLHSGFNIVASGGLTAYFGAVLFETSPELFLGSLLVLAFEAIVIVTALLGPLED